ncbi:MAG: hypothetical protein ACE5GN_03680, partial [Waddliaceae bacterium]
MPNIDPDAGSVTGPTGPRGLPPVEEEKEEPEINLLALSTISQSEAERALAVLLMGYPSLVEPLDPEVLQAAIGARMAEIGSQIWDKFLEHLAEEKARIRDYLNSPKYHQWLETRSQAYLAKMESQMDVNTPGDTLSEKIRNHILSVWTNAMEGVSSYIRETRDEHGGAAAFMAASFVITAGFIGDYMNIVDVASTE